VRFDQVFKAGFHCGSLAYLYKVVRNDYIYDKS
jgi:hypothetical protein